MADFDCTIPSYATEDQYQEGNVSIYQCLFHRKLYQHVLVAVTASFDTRERSCGTTIRHGPETLAIYLGMATKPLSEGMGFNGITIGVMVSASRVHDGSLVKMKSRQSIRKLA